MLLDRHLNLTACWIIITVDITVQSPRALDAGMHTNNQPMLKQLLLQLQVQYYDY